MRRLVLIPLILWSLMAKGFDWKLPIAVSHQGEPLEVRLEGTNLASVKPSQLFPLLASVEVSVARGDIATSEGFIACGLTYTWRCTTSGDSDVRYRSVRRLFLEGLFI